MIVDVLVTNAVFHINLLWFPDLTIKVVVLILSTVHVSHITNILDIPVNEDLRVCTNKQDALRIALIALCSRALTAVSLFSDLVMNFMKFNFLSLRKKEKNYWCYWRKRKLILLLTILCKN